MFKNDKTYVRFRYKIASLRGSLVNWISVHKRLCFNGTAAAAVVGCTTALAIVKHRNQDFNLKNGPGF